VAIEGLPAVTVTVSLTAGTDPVGVGLTVMNLVEVVVDLIVEVLSDPTGESADFSPALGVTTG
jgi:hypothetical protein